MSKLEPKGSDEPLEGSGDYVAHRTTRKTALFVFASRRGYGHWHELERDVFSQATTYIVQDTTNLTWGCSGYRTAFPNPCTISGLLPGETARPRTTPKSYQTHNPTRDTNTVLSFGCYLRDRLVYQCEIALDKQLYTMPLRNVQKLFSCPPDKQAKFPALINNGRRYCTPMPI